MRRIEEVLDGAGRICILGHIHPDGDCVGACLGLYNYLKSACPEAQVTVHLEPFSEYFSFLQGTEQVDHAFPELPPYDLCFVMDCGDRERLGPTVKYFDSARRKVCVDHHITNQGFGDVWEVQPDASSACEVLYSLLDPAQISRDTAECLYLGIVHDTGVFKHSNTSRRTMEVAGQLLEKGISPAYIIDETFSKKSFAQNKALGRALLSARLWLDGRLVAGVITARDMEELGLDSRHLDGIVDQLRVTDGAKLAVFLYPSNESQQEWKVSMRSNDKVDVSRIAVSFGGGGHVKAAGCTLRGEWTAVVDQVAALAEQQMRETE